MVASDLRFDISNPEEYEKDLKRCAADLARKKLHPKETLKQLQGEISPHEEGIKPTRKYYSRILINLSDHAGWR